MLRMTVSPNMVMATPGVGVDKTRHIVVAATNVGTARTTLRALTVACYPSRWLQGIGRHPSKTGVVINTGPFCKQLPCSLDVGEEWRAFLLQGIALEGLEGEKVIEFQLWHSAARRPVRVRLELHENNG